MDLSHTSRRDFLKASGALVVSVMIPGTVPIARAQTSGVGDGKPPLLPDELDSWIAILPDGNVTAFFGKMDMGQGVDVAIGQIVAEELDVRFERVNVVMGDTAFTCNQGGASGSTGIQNGALTLRYAAAEARRLLLERAAEKLGVPAEKLAVKEGVVSVIGESQRTTTYGELIGGQHFHHKLEWNKRYGNPLLAKGQTTPKKPAEYNIVGRSIPQKIVARKIYGSLQYVTDVKVDGMLHARVIRPPSAGCGPVAIDESSISDISGARVVREKDIVAVVAEHEWDAVRATLGTGTQKPHFARDGIAKLVGLPPEKVHAIWVPGPGSYGRNDAGDAAHDAALLSKLTGKPVRVQYMRNDATGWDPKGPAGVYPGRAGPGAAGHAGAFSLFAPGFPRQERGAHEGGPQGTPGGPLPAAPRRPTAPAGASAPIRACAAARAP